MVNGFVCLRIPERRRRAINRDTCGHCPTLSRPRQPREATAPSHSARRRVNQPRLAERTGGGGTIARVSEISARLSPLVWIISSAAQTLAPVWFAGLAPSRGIER